MSLTEHHPFRSAQAKQKYSANNKRIAKKYWPVESRERLVETSFGQTFIRENGSEDNPPLILLPGGNNTSLMWWQNIEELSNHFHTFSLDNIADFGRSIPARDIQKPDEFGVWLSEVFDGLGLESNINIAGLSYGGWMTALYALKHPERLNRIVLLAPAATVLPLRKQFWVRVIFSALVPFRFCTKNLVYWLCEDMQKKDDRSRKILEDAIDDMYCGIRSFKPRKLPLPTVMQDSELQRLSVPTLYLVGQNEKIYPAMDAVNRLNRIAPDIRTAIIPHAGHDLVFVRPEVITQHIIGFLKE